MLFNESLKNSAKKEWNEYVKLLKAVGALSRIFSNNSAPLINYRAVENIFCKSFNAENLSRSDIAFDAKYHSLGIGIKTFLCNKKNNYQKIAEFNKHSKELSKLDIENLPNDLGKYRNERIDFAKRTYGVENSIYHIVARTKQGLILFNTPYNKIHLKQIKKVQYTNKEKKTIEFCDNLNSYRYNFSKSTLYRKFSVPKNAIEIPIEIIDDPYSLILDIAEVDKKELFKTVHSDQSNVILPLYSTRKFPKSIPQKSGLNLWNAGGRPRNKGEIYIPIPAEIHKKHPNFFPPRNKSFDLAVPTGNILKANVCQANSKALMTDPNKDLSDWLLRKVLKLEEGKLADYNRLSILGFDSVNIIKHSSNSYKIETAPIDSYENFIKLM
ncbi:MAG: NgoFVII family restriction endonuclease [Flavobacteriaceae bacterium]|nr:NgoFVII family restriction endonuclease [Flavobacteriaceae bacterium]